ncbi:ATP-dependent DNA ligase [Candidatus Pacearchaeota archaeon]|nr:ATP-dependent DNA ligase [Candidatus Pacearchaeota archaeon]
MKYKKLAEVYEDLTSTTKRLEKTDILSKFLKKVPKKDEDVMYLLLGSVFPEYSEKRIGISNRLAIQAMSKATGLQKKEVVKLWKKIGDLGKVAEELAKNKKQSTLSSGKKLTTQKVIENVKKLPEIEGKGSVSRKISLITELLTNAEPIEAKYIIRTLIGDLRIGVGESTIRDAMADAFFKNKKEVAKKIQRALDRTNDIGLVFQMAKKGKVKDLEAVGIEVGKPLKVMLAQKADSIKQGFEKVGKPCAIEYKYDGFRMLIHKKGKKLTLFTRRLENVTKQFPEVVDYIDKYVKGKEFILDSEAVGWDRQTKQYKPFQKISQRIRRKYDIEKLQKKLPVEINVFDILYYNGKSQIDEPYKKRTKLLRKIIKKHPYKIIPSKKIVTDNGKKAKKFFKKALKDNQEGIMMKNLNAKYQPGKRVGHMLKIKPEERDLDLVITGAEYGTGKRSGWMSSFVLSCKGKKKGEFLEIGKVGTGIKEKKAGKSGGISFGELTEKLQPYVIEEKGKKVKIKPKVVVSVTYQEIQHSPNYNSGWALRFPRFTAIRPDKPVKEIANLKEIEKDFKDQKRNWRYG